MINSGGVIEELLKRKILDRDLPIDEIIEEDRQAILVFLRNTAFGSDYNVIVIDQKTNEEFVTKVDLSTLKVKDFTLTEDSNGEYSFKMEKSKVDITFSFLI